MSDYIQSHSAQAAEAVHHETPRASRDQTATSPPRAHPAHRGKPLARGAALSLIDFDGGDAGRSPGRSVGDASSTRV